MQIICPSCEAIYAVPDEKLAGRMVKCARCSTTWTPAPPPVAALPTRDIEHRPEPRKPAMLAPPEPRPPPLAIAETIRRPEPQWPFVSATAPSRPEPRPKGLMVAWVASIALLGAVVAGAYARRDAVMEAWPPSQRLYAAFGLR
jgi:predicted Zn finger-like uncharacterized protein